jgi:ankyrin repeat protein
MKSSPLWLLLQDGATALHFAAVTGHTGVVGQLLTAGAVTDAANKVRPSPHENDGDRGML